jgi:pyruvate dehydrogenase E1 component alpha subunit
MDKDIDFQLWKEITRIRMTELFIAEKYAEREMRCPVHLSLGQEIAASCLSQHLGKEDKVFSAHRAHAHYLAKGGNLGKLFGELYGKVTGCTRGRGGSMHLMDLEVGFVAAVPIVGSSIPIGVGMAWGEKLQDLHNIVVIYLGEGATEEGVFSESLDFCSLWKIPVLFIVENNLYSIYTHVSQRQSPQRSICKIAEAHGIKSYSANDNDPCKLSRLLKCVADEMRITQIPILVEVKTHRWLEHCGPNDDEGLGYREPGELKFAKSNCGLALLERVLVEKGIPKLEFSAFKDSVSKEILSAYNDARKAEYPQVAEILSA